MMSNKLSGNKLPGNKFPCDVVRDLFPSYIDGLTSDTTNEIIKEHVEECAPCKDILVAMQAPTAPIFNMEEKKEVDFLKKNRRRNGIIAVGSMIAALFVVAIVLCIKTFFVGRYAYPELMAWDLEVNGNRMELEVMLGRQSAVSSVDYEEEAGVVKVSAEYVGRSIFNQKSDYKSEYIADEEIKQVWIGDRIIWSQGEKISGMTSKVYNTAHAYMGDMPANFETTAALDMTYYLGAFKNELKSSEKPYVWRMCLEEDISEKDRENKEQLMVSYACVLLAVIENLDKVEFEYTLDGEAQTLSMDAEQATEAIGIDIKECGREAALLEKLIRETSLNLYVYNRDLTKEEMEEALRIKLTNYTEIPIATWSITYFLDGEVCGTQTGMKADGSNVTVGEDIEFSLTPMDFADEKWDDVTTVEVKIQICDENGNEYIIDGIDSFPKEFWVSYKFLLKGNSTEGFVACQ